MSKRLGISCCYLLSLCRRTCYVDYGAATFAISDVVQPGYCRRRSPAARKFMSMRLRFAPSLTARDAINAHVCEQRSAARRILGRAPHEHRSRHHEFVAVERTNA